jgi:putative hydrolases of HD superfamily
MPAGNHQSVAAFARLAIGLKQIRRQGWVDRGVTDPESVADHSWSVALLAWLLAAERPDLDRERVLLLGIVHDLPEAVAGDATPFDRHRDESGQIDPALFLEAPGYPADERNLKHQREKEALEQMLAGVPAGLAADIRSAWSEYEANSTPEARFVKQVDKLETAMQAFAYRHDDPRLVVDSFLRGAELDIEDERLLLVLKDLDRDADPG